MCVCVGVCVCVCVCVFMDDWCLFNFIKKGQMRIGLLICKNVSLFACFFRLDVCVLGDKHVYIKSFI